MDSSPQALSDHELMILYKALCAYACSRQGAAEFRNSDPAHPFYLAAAHGEEYDSKDPGARPEGSALFVLGHALHNECVKRSPLSFEDWFPHDFTAVFAHWETFCECALEAYVQRTRPTPPV